MPVMLPRTGTEGSRIINWLKAMDIHQLVLQQIDAQAVARDTLAFIEVKSETGQEGPGSVFLADLLRREGFDVTFDEVESGRPNIYAHIRGTENGGRSLLLNGH